MHNVHPDARDKKQFFSVFIKIDAFTLVVLSAAGVCQQRGVQTAALFHFQVTGAVRRGPVTIQHEQLWAW